ncbi:MAG: hypothetical protein J07HQX50_02157 [Haloquadratum sp. J07HQX50]|nr:MAG: hypothetical protein J07HQX50_02157 [Haloquadratum sp. J07HQX50]
MTAIRFDIGIAWIISEASVLSYLDQAAGLWFDIL